MRRVTVAAIMTETGLSRATVDRVLNGRGRVHPRTQHVIQETIRKLQTPVAEATHNALAADMILRVGRGMTRQMTALWQARGVKGGIHDVYDASEAQIVQTITDLARDTTRPMILTVKNTDNIVQALQQARSRGKRIVTLVSDVGCGST
jgi:LacI family transcriptional regulator